MMNTQQPPEWFRGAGDIHVHTAPSLFRRRYDDLELAQVAAAARMQAVVLKSHAGDTAARADIANRAVDGVRVFGGVVLNQFVGGINPHAVQASVQMGGRVVWMPTMHAANHIAHYGGAGYTEQPGATPPTAAEPVRVLGDNGELLPAVQDVLNVIAAHPDVILVNGHLSAPATLALFRAATRRGIERLVVSHPRLQLTAFDADTQAQLVQLGAMIEHCYLPHTPEWGEVPFTRTAADIQAVGVEHSLLSTDLGQANQISPPTGLQRFGERLIAAGILPEDVRRLLVDNPARLLGL